MRAALSIDQSGLQSKIRLDLARKDDWKKVKNFTPNCLNISVLFTIYEIFSDEAAFYVLSARVHFAHDPYSAALPNPAARNDVVVLLPVYLIKAR